MHLSRIRITNFRNFHDFNVRLGRTSVVVGENSVGKTNLIFALRLILDPRLPESSRQLREEDFWEGLPQPVQSRAEIEVAVEFQDFQNEKSIFAILQPYCVIGPAPDTARLTYRFRPKSHLVNHPDLSINDYEFLVFGGIDEKNRLDFDVRRWIPIEVLPALRDAESDLAAWRQSPLRPLIEKLDIDHATLEEVACRIDDATEHLLADDEIQQLVLKIQERISKMVGGVRAIETSLGFTPTVPERLARELRLFGDGTRQRRVGELSLGLNNVLYLALLALELERKDDASERASTTLAIEEPEAHLHPHLQRLVFRDFLRRKSPLVLTTHSPNIASVAPLASIVLLRDDPNGDGTKGTSTYEAGFSEQEVADLERYLDATRAEVLFARGVILVEGAAEMFLVPEIAAGIGKPLDQHGITVCSVHGIDFMPYAKLLGPKGLNIPFVVLTDGDWRMTSGGERVSAGLRRAVRLASVLSPDQSADLVNMYDQRQWDTLCEAANQMGIFVGDDTLEVDLFNGGQGQAMVGSMAELGLTTASTKVLRQISERGGPLSGADSDTLLKLVERLGKGRVSQRLASQIDAAKAPVYIKESISKIVEKLAR